MTCLSCDNKTVCKHYGMPKSKMDYAKVLNLPQSNKVTLQQKPTIPKPYKMADFEINYFVVVIFDKIWYPGIVKKIFKRKLLIKFADRVSKKIFWPPKSYEQELFYSQILCIIDPLTEEKTNRGETLLKMTNQQFKFIDLLADNCIIYEQLISNYHLYYN